MARIHRPGARLHRRHRVVADTPAARQLRLVRADFAEPGHTVAVAVLATAADPVLEPAGEIALQRLRVAAACTGTRPVEQRRHRDLEVAIGQADRLQHAEEDLVGLPVRADTARQHLAGRHGGAGQPPAARIPLGVAQVVEVQRRLRGGHVQHAPAIDGVGTRLAHVARRLEDDLGAFLRIFRKPRPAVVHQRNRARHQRSREGRARAAHQAAIAVRHQQHLARRHDRAHVELVAGLAHAVVQQAGRAGLVGEAGHLAARTDGADHDHSGIGVEVPVDVLRLADAVIARGDDVQRVVAITRDTGVGEHVVEARRQRPALFAQRQIDDARFAAVQPGREIAGLQLGDTGGDVRPVGRAVGSERVVGRDLHARRDAHHALAVMRAVDQAGDARAVPVQVGAAAG